MSRLFHAASMRQLIFSIFCEATRSMSFLTAPSKRISARKSPPMGVILMISPSPKALWRTLSPTEKLTAGALFGAAGAGKAGARGGFGAAAMDAAGSRLRL